MKTVETVFDNSVTISDWGEPEYLDGAQMQYMVTIEAVGSVGACLAYFSDFKDAEMFARAKSEQLAGASEDAEDA